MHYFVLGAGLVGSAIVRDLAQDGAQVTVIDFSPAALARIAALTPARTVQADLLATADFGPLLAGADLVVCAVPGFMGFSTLQKIIAAGKPVVDISFFAEDPFVLDELARSQGVTAVVDCGVAPGLVGAEQVDLPPRLQPGLGGGGWRGHGGRHAPAGAGLRIQRGQKGSAGGGLRGAGLLHPAARLG